MSKAKTRMRLAIFIFFETIYFIKKKRELDRKEGLRRVSRTFGRASM